MDVSKTHRVVEMSRHTLFTRLPAYRVALFWLSICICSDSDDVGPVNLLRMWLISVGIHLICISSSPIQFADAFLESRYPKCVKIRWRSNIARSHTFSDVVMSEGIKGMSPAKCLDDSEEIAGSKMIPSNYTPACRKLCFCTSVARLNHHNIRHAPLLRLARPLSSRNFCTRVISPGTILSRRLI